jgi:hypothetical protein
MKTRIRSRLAHHLAALGVIYAACSTFFAPVAHAGPLLYIITFTTASGLAPTGGSFLYDASASVGSQFSSFYVNWDGQQFDLTAPANAPSDGAGALAECALLPFQFLSTGSDCSTHATGFPNWEGAAPPYESEPVFSFEDNDGASDGGSMYIIDGVTSGSTASPDDTPAVGEWSIALAATNVPEPSTIMLVLAGGGWLLYRKRGSPATKRARPTDQKCHPLP